MLKPTIPTEHQEQAALMELVRMHEDKIPELKNMTAIPLGGFRAKRTACILAAEGVRAGYPDILLDVAKHGYHGLRIEMKRMGNKPTQLQRDWHERLVAQGYAVVVCYSAEEAWDTILKYLGTGEMEE